MFLAHSDRESRDLGALEQMDRAEGLHSDRRGSRGRDQHAPASAVLDEVRRTIDADTERLARLRAMQAQAASDGGPDTTHDTQGPDPIADVLPSHLVARVAATPLPAPRGGGGGGGGATQGSPERSLLSVGSGVRLRKTLPDDPERAGPVQPKSSAKVDPDAAGVRAAPRGGESSYYSSGWNGGSPRRRHRRREHRRDHRRDHRHKHGKGADKRSSSRHGGNGKRADKHRDRDRDRDRHRGRRHRRRSHGSSWSSSLTSSSSSSDPRSRRRHALPRIDSRYNAEGVIADQLSSFQRTLDSIIAKSEQRANEQRECFIFFFDFF
jgi:hypothetical protein